MYFDISFQNDSNIIIVCTFHKEVLCILMTCILMTCILMIRASIYCFSFSIQAVFQILFQIQHQSIVSDSASEYCFRFSGISFSDSASMQFRFNQHYMKQDVMTAINDIKFVGGRTRTEAALDMMVCHTIIAIIEI